MKREDNDLMRTNILDAVIKCKTEAAGAEVSLSQISCGAGISERTLNRYFPDKEMMLYEAAIRHLQQLYEAFAKRYMETDKSGMNALQRLILIVRMQIERNINDADFAKTFVRAFTTALRTAVYRDLPVSGYDASVRDIVLKCIEDGIADGSMRNDVVPMDTYLMISSNYMGLVQRMIYFYSVNFSREEHKKELLLVFNKYVRMLEEYLSAKGRAAVSPTGAMPERD